MSSRSKKVRFVCISDTHNHGPGEGFKLPAGDVLVHAGDLTNQGSHDELKKALDWIQKADFAIKIVVAGMVYSAPCHPVRLAWLQHGLLNA